jgi:hypothetical protein
MITHKAVIDEDPDYREIAPEGMSLPGRAYRRAGRAKRLRPARKRADIAKNVIPMQRRKCPVFPDFRRQRAPI